MAIFIQFQTSMSSSEDQKGSARGYPGGTSSAHEKMRHMACALAAPLQRVRSPHGPRHHLFSHLTLVIPPGVCLGSLTFTVHRGLVAWSQLATRTLPTRCE